MKVVSLGGSLLFGDNNEFDVSFLKNIAALFAKHKDIAIVVGGGKIARSYVSLAREFKVNEFNCDSIAIKATHVNAALVAAIIPNAIYCNNLDEATAAVDNRKIPVLGGQLPGVTTDAISVLLAEKLDAKTLLNLSNVSYVYSADPNVDKSAKKIEKMSHPALTKLASENDTRMARTNFPFDLVACKLAQRSNIELRFVDGKNVKEVENALNDKPFSGTIVKN
ncbi:MAG: UMP kinase [Candidatus Micrarchaeota archaeon]